MYFHLHSSKKVATRSGEIVCACAHGALPLSYNGHDAACGTRTRNLLVSSDVISPAFAEKCSMFRTTIIERNALPTELWLLSQPPGFEPGAHVFLSAFASASIKPDKRRQDILPDTLRLPGWSRTSLIQCSPACIRGKTPPGDSKTRSARDDLWCSHACIHTEPNSFAAHANNPAHHLLLTARSIRFRRPSVLRPAVRPKMQR